MPRKYVKVKAVNRKTGKPAGDAQVRIDTSNEIIDRDIAAGKRGMSNTAADNRAVAKRHRKAGRPGLAVTRKAMAAAKDAQKKKR